VGGPYRIERLDHCYRARETVVQDSQLLQRVLSGEKQAFRALVLNHHAAMTRFARTIVGDARAEEVVQEAWLKVVGRDDSFPVSG
jgi:DNA-directed RNA polymerase specialized sigma24 family protein